MSTSPSPKALLVKQWARALKAREPSRARNDLVLHIHEYALPKECRKGATLNVDRRTGRMQLDVSTRIVGQHFFPPDIEAVKIPKRQRPSGDPDSHGALHDLRLDQVHAAQVRQQRAVRPRFRHARVLLEQGGR